MKRALSGREIELLTLVASGATYKAAAHEMGISRETARNHGQSIICKLGVPNITAAAVDWFVEAPGCGVHPWRMADWRDPA